MHRQPFPEELMSAVVSRYYLNTYREIEQWLSRTAYPTGRPRPFKKVCFEFTEEQLTVARSRGAKTNGNPSRENQSPDRSSKSDVRWINVSLGDADAAFLAESVAGFSELAAMACEFVTDGYSLTVKPMDGGDSVMACIIGRATDNPDVTVGLSGFASNVRDALLVLCYKFEDKLGRELPCPGEQANTSRSRFR